MAAAVVDVLVPSRIESPSSPATLWWMWLMASSTSTRKSASVELRADDKTILVPCCCSGECRHCSFPHTAQRQAWMNLSCGRRCCACWLYQPLWPSMTCCSSQHRATQSFRTCASSGTQHPTSTWFSSSSGHRWIRKSTSVFMITVCSARFIRYIFCWIRHLIYTVMHKFNMRYIPWKVTLNCFFRKSRHYFNGMVLGSKNILLHYELSCHRIKKSLCLQYHRSLITNQPVCIPRWLVSYSVVGYWSSYSTFMSVLMNLFSHFDIHAVSYMSNNLNLRS